ncbi:MAG: Asp-tRNA(Asn)/Glu-tRNA(Gln) amidotransferase subunit GatC [Gammaproteobacteria bacterium]|nr:Asp-tRNA(Asn)/Glu-tRNA(Gln) amidotransferase subunit GatC [Gammaproteobacteria bacterium]TVQ49358.1 MAG: Asp-tRNA(Asn)/Glu-tRNA(Gln) amidotransferase subunit GatC [Gammaproteobacteria bacterium]
MSLTNDQVRGIARLARLSLDEAEVAEVADKLASILGMVDQLQATDTAGVVPMAHPLDAAQQLRADEVIETDHREEYQRNAPLTEQGLYLVPRVVE